MALNITPQASPLASKVVEDTDVDSTVKTNITGAPGSIYQIDVDNTANIADDVYIKIYNDGSPVVGQSDPDLIILVKNSIRRSLVIPEGMEFDTAISYCCVVEPGTEGSTDPTEDVILRLVTS